MADLSPAAKAILKAAYKATRNPKWQTNFYASYAAAVLRATADQLTPYTVSEMEGAAFARNKLLAIANELNGDSNV